MIPEGLMTIAFISFLGMLSPGPDFFLVAKNALSHSRKAAMATTLGINAAITLHISYCILGLAYLIQNTPWLFLSIKYVGAGYLIFLGIQCLGSKGTVSLEETTLAPLPLGTGKAFLQGFLCNLLNPKATIFFLSLFTQVVNANTSVGTRAIYGAVIIIQGLCYWPLVVLFIQNARVKNTLQRAQKGIDRLLGGVLVTFGIKIAVT